MKSKFLSFIFAPILFVSALSADPIKLEMWHGMEGFMAEKLEEIVNKFNGSQKEYVVQPVFKGKYSDTFKLGVTAAKEKKGAPHILQVYEIATPTFLKAKNLYIPVHQLLGNYGYALPEKALIPAIASFYSDNKNQLLGLPFNISTGLLFYNKDAFQKAGLDPNTPPKTWEDVEAYSLKLKNAGYTCGITTAWPSGYLLEHFSARHNLPFASHENGFKGIGAELRVNSPSHVYNITKLAEWQKSGVFKYAGRDLKDAEKLFTSGQCAMVMQSNSRMAILRKAAPFDIGGGPVPYWKAIANEPHNLVTGGAALWAMKGHSQKEEKGVAKFLNFLAQPENQQFWVEATGYLPISEKAYDRLKASGYYEKNPHNDIGVGSLMLPSTTYSRGIRIPGFVEVREVLIDAMEAAFDGKKAPKEALDEAVLKGNALIQKAEKEGL